MWGNNPACLRVQAQLQRRARTNQQAAEGARKNNGDTKDIVETKTEESSSESVDDKTVEGSVEACGALGEEKSSGADGATDVIVPVNSADIDQLACNDTTICTVVDDSDDTITTLPEDESTDKDSDDAFVISPAPSPEKLLVDGEEKSGISEGDNLNILSTNNSQSSNSLSKAEAEDSASSTPSGTDASKLPNILRFDKCAVLYTLMCCK